MGEPTIRMTWNPYQNVNYNELQLLQPYVERRTPYMNGDVPLPFSCSELLKRDMNEIEVIVSHDDSVCPIIDADTKDRGLCWRITLRTPNDDPDLQILERSLLSDHDVSSMMIGRELFFERGRYALDIKFECDPSKREGMVFRESRRIATVLQKKPILPGSFQFLDIEQLQIELTKGNGGIYIMIRSGLTGEIVNRGTLVLPERSWSVDEVFSGFKRDTETFIQSYFGEDESLEDRVTDYREMLDTMKRYLNDLKKKR